VTVLDLKTAFWRFIAVFAVVTALTACSSDDDDGIDEAGYVEGSVEQLYNSAMDNLLEGERKTAANLFIEVERQHPYSVWATKAQLMFAYTKYVDGDYGEAIIGLDRFIQLHPGNRDIAYAYYLKALSYYRQITDVGRDQRVSEQALAAFRELVRRFPTSRYARDGRHKIDLVLDHLAGKEMAVGRFYQQRGDHLAAINRFKVVTQKFDTTTQVPEALHRLIESYTALGLTEDARRVAAVLGYNYPGSGWYFDTYKLVEGVEVEGRPAEEDDSGFLDWLF